MASKEYLDKVDRTVRQHIEYDTNRLSRIERFDLFRNMYLINKNFITESLTVESLVAFFVFLCKSVGSFLLIAPSILYDIYNFITTIKRCIKIEILKYYIRRNKTYIEWKNNNGKV